jgi:hypothetical protein
MVVVAVALRVLWAVARMIMTWGSRPRESLVERLTPYAPSTESSWTDEEERWLSGFGEAEPE